MSKCWIWRTTQPATTTASMTTTVMTTSIGSGACIHNTDCETSDWCTQKEAGNSAGCCLVEGVFGTFYHKIITTKSTWQPWLSQCLFETKISMGLPGILKLTASLSLKIDGWKLEDKHISTLASIWWSPPILAERIKSLHVNCSRQ